MNWINSKSCNTVEITWHSLKIVNVQQLQCLGSCNINLVPLFFMDTNLHFIKLIQSLSHTNLCSLSSTWLERKCEKKRRYACVQLHRKDNLNGRLCLKWEIVGLLVHDGRMTVRPFNNSTAKDIRNVKHKNQIKIHCRYSQSKRNQFNEQWAFMCFLSEGSFVSSWGCVS